MKVVIMAGGKGTRMLSIASDIPKPMIPIEGRPVLEHEIEGMYTLKEIEALPLSTAHLKVLKAYLKFM